MLIDTIDKQVIFRQDEVLTVNDLWVLIDLLDDSVQLEVKLEESDPLVGIKGIYERRSDILDYTYVVVVCEDDFMACSCPDWIHRRSVWGDECKHIRGLRYIGVI